MPNPPNEASSAIKVLAHLNRLSLNAFRSETKQSLIFQILNDTAQIVPYDRAVLWNLEGKHPKMLGVSGQVDIPKGSSTYDEWLALVGDLKTSNVPHKLCPESFDKLSGEFQTYQDEKTQPVVHWFPLFARDKLIAGLWLERWDSKEFKKDELDILNYLVQAYSAAWEKFIKRGIIAALDKKHLAAGLAFLALILFVPQVPLRVVAPCQVVPKTPSLVTAPLDGIISEVTVLPGQFVDSGSLLFEYDKRVPEQQLRIAQKQVEISNSELNRAKALALDGQESKDEQDSLTQVAVLNLELEKEQAKLNLAQHQASQLDVFSPHEGYVVMDAPEEWRGKPVVVGERVMMVSKPDETKVRIWLPEDDNVPLDSSKNIKIFLNISPESSTEATLSYIADASQISAAGIPSFVAEAQWTEAQPNIKPGLKGTAVLYGDDVTVAYWIFRRPWAYFRQITGF